MDLKNFINNWFFARNGDIQINEDSSKKSVEKTDGEKNLFNSAKSIYGAKKKSEETFFFNIENKRTSYMTKNMDLLLDEIKHQITVEPLLKRVIRNINKLALKNGYDFKMSDDQKFNKEKVKKVKTRFEKILNDSGYYSNSFIKELLSNIIKYSNCYVKPVRDEQTKQIVGVFVVQNRGFTTKETIGEGIVTKFNFSISKNRNLINMIMARPAGKVLKVPEDIWHCAFDKETDEIFGMPVWVSVIPFIKKYNYLISNSIDSYSDQSLQQVIYQVGKLKTGQFKSVTPESYKDLVEQLEINNGDDIITDVPVEALTIQKNFSSPDKLLESLLLQIISGLFTSESQLGKSGAGRQDSETQQENTNTIVEEFQSALEDFINRTLVKEICIDLFGNYENENNISFVFNDNFDLKERKEKHTIFKFQSGLIDLDEARDCMGYKESINIKKTFKKLYGENKVDGKVESVNNPTNQHNPGGTGTTKPSKKQ